MKISILRNCIRRKCDRVSKKHSKPLVGPSSKFDFHQAVFELLLLVLYKFNFQRLSGTTLFISQDYSYNPTSRPFQGGMTYVMGFTSNHKWVEFNTIILDYKYLQYLKSPVKMTISENYLFEWKDFYTVNTFRIRKSGCWFCKR